MIKRVCITSAAPANPNPDTLELGEFTLRAGAGHVYPLGPVGSKQTPRGMDAAHFAASFDAIISWIPLHANAVRRIHDINPQTRVGLALAVESITAAPHNDPILDSLRESLLQFCYKPPVDYYANDPAPWPNKPHCMAVDFEHRPQEVVKAVTGWLSKWVRPLELDLVFFDVLLRSRYWGQAPNIPEVPPNDWYAWVWSEIVAWCQAHVAPVWGHSDVGADRSLASHTFRVVEHFYRLGTLERRGQVAAAAAHGLTLVRSGEWRDIEPKLSTVRMELDRDAAAGDAWVVSARSGGAFGIWS